MSNSLRRYLITRLLMTIPMVLILVTMIFFVMRVLPGDPIRSQLGPRVSEEQADALRERLGLNRPLIVQYFDFIGDMVTFNFGTALTQGEASYQGRIGRKVAGNHRTDRSRYGHHGNNRYLFRGLRGQKS